jgi:hypothetical protein
MPELDDDQRRAMHLLEGIPKPGILSWFQTSEIGRTALKALGRKLAQREEHHADRSGFIVFERPRQTGPAQPVAGGRAGGGAAIRIALAPVMKSGLACRGKIRGRREKTP